MTAGSWWSRTALLLAMVSLSSACIPGPLVPRGSGENVAFAMPKEGDNPRSRFDESTVERALSCSDLDALQVTINALVGGMVEAVDSGLVRPERFTKLDDESGLVGEYRLLQPFQVFGRPLLGVSNALGMLPAVTALFDDRLGSLRRVYERAGFRFQCKKVAELDGESCEARRDVPAGAAPPRAPPLMYVVILTESRAMLKYGRTLVACTVLPREGNPFR